MRRRQVGLARTRPGRRPRTRRHRLAVLEVGTRAEGGLHRRGDEIGGRVNRSPVGVDRSATVHWSLEGTGGRTGSDGSRRTSGRWCPPATAPGRRAGVGPCTPRPRRPTRPRSRIRHALLSRACPEGRTAPAHGPAPTPSPLLCPAQAAPVITTPVRDKAEVGVVRSWWAVAAAVPSRYHRAGAAEPRARPVPRNGRQRQGGTAAPEEAAARTAAPGGGGAGGGTRGRRGGRRHGEVQCRLALQATDRRHRLLAEPVDLGPARGRWPRGRPGRRGHGNMGRPTCSSAHRPWPDRPWPWPGRPGPSPCRGIPSEPPGRSRAVGSPPVRVVIVGAGSDASWAHGHRRGLAGQRSDGQADPDALRAPWATPLRAPGRAGGRH